MIGGARRTLWIFLFLSVPCGGFGGGMRLQGQVPDSTVTVRGRVLEHETEFLLPDAVVTLASNRAGYPEVWTRVSGSAGDFRFGEVFPGLYELSVSRVGYRDLVDTLRVEPGFDLILTLPLSVEPVALEPIVVVAWVSPFGALAGFERRRRVLSGTFLDREEIEATNPYVFTDLLRRVPGARIVSRPPLGNQIFFRGGCVPDLVLDGTRIGSNEGIDSFLLPMDVEAVEVYNGAFLPAELGVNSCGAIVVWSRRAEPAPARVGIWRQLLIAAGFVVVSVLIAR